MSIIEIKRRTYEIAASCLICDHAEIDGDIAWCTQEDNQKEEGGYPEYGLDDCCSHFTLREFLYDVPEVRGKI